MTIKERAVQVPLLLEQEYPDATCALHYQTDYELLFATRLSAQCTDARVNQVTPALFARFPRLEDYAAADVSEIESLIQSCGLFHTKARDIKAAAQMLLEEYHGQMPDTMEQLLRLPGVGRKTANLILGDLFHQPAIVADTHCIRLSNRLGFVKNTKDPLKVEQALKKLIAPDKQSDFCHRLVHHGRVVCTARKPLCAQCCLSAVCPSFGQA